MLLIMTAPEHTGESLNEEASLAAYRFYRDNGCREIYPQGLFRGLDIKEKEHVLPVLIVR